MSTQAPVRLLIVDDEVAQMRALCDTLTEAGYVTRGFASGVDAVAALREQPFDLLLTDLMMPQIDGIALLRACHEVDPELACVVMTGHGTIATAVEALRAGALDYILKPFKLNTILTTLTRVLNMRSLRLENIQLRESVSIYELSRAISQGLEHDEIVERTVAAARRQTDAGAVYLLVPEADGRGLRVARAAGPGAEPLSDEALHCAEALEQWRAVAGAELEGANAQGDLHALYAHPFGERIVIALPILARRQFYGVLGFSSARPHRRISSGQVKALEVLARTAATAFATAALLARLRRMNEELEVRVRERTRDLELANQELESFSYSVSHDLREPLRAVEGFCEMFRTEFGDAVPEGGRAMLERIWAGARRMTRLIDDLLHFSRFSRVPLERLPVAVKTMALQVIERLRERPGARQITIDVGDLPDCCGDPALLEQVWVNLLSNAFKFTAPREAPRVEVGSLRQGEALVYYVRDNGVGFDMRHAERLFGVFQRLHSQDSFEGTGIGLSIVQRIIARHGGKVWADSRPGEGATFYFSLPATPQAGAA